MGVPNNSAFEHVLEQMKPMLEVAYNTGLTVGHGKGYEEGFVAGQVLGYIEGVNALTPAVSDGLRHGSSLCGAAMQGLRRLGLQEDDESSSVTVVIPDLSDD